MIATRIKMIATKQPIKMRVLLSSTLRVGSVRKDKDNYASYVLGEMMKTKTG